MGASFADSSEERKSAHERAGVYYGFMVFKFELSARSKFERTCYRGHTVTCTVRSSSSSISLAILYGNSPTATIRWRDETLLLMHEAKLV